MQVNMPIRWGRISRGIHAAKPTNTYLTHAASNMLIDTAPPRSPGCSLDSLTIHDGFESLPGSGSVIMRRTKAPSFLKSDGFSPWMIFTWPKIARTSRSIVAASW